MLLNKTKKKKKQTSGRKEKEADVRRMNKGKKRAIGKEQDQREACEVLKKEGNTSKRSCSLPEMD